MIKGFIFDLDGTVCDSNCIWEEIDRAVFEAHGISFTEEELHSCAAMTYEEVAEFFTEKGVPITVDSMMEEMNALARREYAENVMLKPFAAEYIRAIRDSGGRIALATASPKELYEPVLTHRGIYDLFDTFLTTDEYGPKDSPDIYLAAAAALGVPPSECAVFEDIVKGITSAKAAGMTAAAVYDRASESERERLEAIADDYLMDFSSFPYLNNTQGENK